MNAPIDECAAAASEWLTAAAAPAGVEVIVQTSLGLRMPPEQAVRAARQLLQAAADATGMMLTIDVSPIPEFIRCRNEHMPQTSGERSANVTEETNVGSVASKSTVPWNRRWQPRTIGEWVKLGEEIAREKWGDERS